MSATRVSVHTPVQVTPSCECAHSSSTHWSEYAHSSASVHTFMGFSATRVSVHTLAQVTLSVHSLAALIGVSMHTLVQCAHSSNTHGSECD